MKAEMLYTVIVKKKKEDITAMFYDTEDITAMFYNKEDAKSFINAQDPSYTCLLSIKKQRIIWTIAENTRG